MAVPGDIEIQKFTIGNLNLLDPKQASFNYLDIYEDVLRPVFVAEVEVLDYNDALGTNMLNGKETVNLSFTVPGADSISFKFSLMQNKHLDDKTSQLSGSMKYKTYKLRMISEDLLINQSKHLAKSFKQPTHQTVKDALQTITSAQVQVPDPCKGEQRLIANHEPVYDFLAKIHDRHVSEKYKSSLYTLFASRKGGQENRTFCTFEYLMDQSSVFNFKQDNTIGGRTTTESDGMNNVIWLKVPDSFNTPISYAAPTKKTTYSPDHGISKVTNKPADNGSQYKKLGQQITGSYIDKTKSDTNPIRNTHVSPTNDEKTTNISDAKVDRANFLKDLAQNAVKFEVNGNPKIAVGNIVTLNIPKKSDADQSAGEKQMNDKVLIVRLRHKIGPASAKPRYTMVVEAIKAGFYESGA